MRPQTDNTPRAIVVIVLAVLALSLGDALIKFTNGDFGLWQIFVLRSVVVVPVLLVLTAITAPQAWRLPLVLFWTTLRSLMLVVMWLIYYIALPHLDLSVAAAAYYTCPVFITLFAAVLTGERISQLGWAAVGLGFLGVLLILRPSAGDFNAYALLPLASAVLYAWSMLLTRTKCRGAHPMILALGMNLGFLGVGGVGLSIGQFLPVNPYIDAWVPMGGSEWGAMACLSLAILIGGIGAAYAYQNGAPKIIGTFDFAYVGFAVLWGILIFGEIPDFTAIIGIAMIIGAGALSIRQ